MDPLHLGQAVADPVGHRLADPLGVVRRAPGPATEPERGAQLRGPGSRSRSPAFSAAPTSPRSTRLVAVGAQLVEAGAVGVARLVVEHLAGVAPPVDHAVAGSAVAQPPVERRRDAGQVGDVELTARLPEQARQVLEALGVAEPDLDAGEGDRPVLALLAGTRRAAGVGRDGRPTARRGSARAPRRRPGRAATRPSRRASRGPATPAPARRIPSGSAAPTDSYSTTSSVAAARGVADEDLAGRRLAAQPRREVDHRADGPVLDAALEAHDAERGVAEADARCRRRARGRARATTR